MQSPDRAHGALVPAAHSIQPIDASKSRQADKSSSQSPRPIASNVMGNHNLNGRAPRGHDWIAGVGDISCPATDLDCSFGHDTAPFLQEEHDLQAKRCPLQPHRNNNNNNNKNNKPTKRTALQRHCAFWDPDQDGLIYPWDIFLGFRKLGFHPALCLWAAITMCICSSYSTQPSWWPHPLFAINLHRIDCCRHGSTTGAYDLDGELDDGRFEAVFGKYAGGEDFFTARTLYACWKGQCCANDFFGWFAGGLEWIAMYILLWPQDGRLRKEDIRGVYDGSIFFEIARARACK